MNSNFYRKNILQNVYDLDFQQTRLSLLNLFNNEEYIENGIVYSRPHFKFLYDSKTKRNLVFINLDLINYLIDEKLIPVTGGLQDEIDILDERVTINYNLIQTIFSTFLERIFFQNDDKVYIYTQKYNLTTELYEFELYDLAGKLNKSEFDNFYSNEFQILENDVLALNTNLNNLQDDFDALTTNLSTNYYTKLQSYSKTEINTFLDNKIDEVTTANNNVWYLYFQRNNTFQLVAVQSQSTIIYYKLFQADTVVYVLRQINNIHSLWNIFQDIFTKTEVNNLLNNYYQKINLVSATRFVLSQTNNVLSLYNLKDDFYDEGEIDLIVSGLETQINTLDATKLTQPVNSSGVNQIIQISSTNVVSLINIPGGSSSTFYTENIGANTAKLRLSGQTFDHFQVDINNFYQQSKNFRITFDTLFQIMNWLNNYSFITIDQSLFMGAFIGTLTLNHQNKLQFLVNNNEKMLIDNNNITLDTLYEMYFKIAGLTNIQLNNTLNLHKNVRHLFQTENSNNILDLQNDRILICDRNTNFNTQIVNLDFFNKSFDTLDATKDFLLSFNCQLRETISNNVFNNQFMFFITKQKAATFNPAYQQNRVVFNSNVEVNTNCQLKCTQIRAINTNTYLSLHDVGGNTMLQINNNNSMTIGFNSSTTLTSLGHIAINGYVSRSSSWIFYGGYIWKSTGNQWISWTSYSSGTVTLTYISLYSSWNIMCAGFVAFNSSAFLKKEIKKIDIKNEDNFDKYFDYDIFSYKMNGQDNLRFGLINENLGKNKIIFDTFQSPQEYFLQLQQEKVEIKQYYSFEDLDFFFQFQNKNMTEIQTNLYFIIQIKYKDDDSELNREYRLIFNENENIFQNIDFNSQFEIEKEERIVIQLNHLSLSNDVEKQCQFALFQTKILYEENKILKEKINSLEERLEKIENLLLNN